MALKFAVSCSLLCFMFIGQGALASAGEIIYSYGNNVALDKDGNRRSLGRGDVVDSGDTLITSARGRMHLRFSDGGMVSVYPRSEYRIDEYSYVESDSKKQRGFFSLLKGGARQITGLLGKLKRDNFRFKTAVATIGIRGTGFFVQLCEDDCFDDDGNLLPDGMYVKNETGIITVTNDAGLIELAQGQSAFTAGLQRIPRQLNDVPMIRRFIARNFERFDFNIRSAIRDYLQSKSLTPIGPLARSYQALDIVLSASTTSASVRQTFNTAGLIPTTIASLSTVDTIYGFDINESTGRGPVAYTFIGGSATLVESGAAAILGVVWSR